MCYNVLSQSVLSLDLICHGNLSCPQMRVHLLLCSPVNSCVRVYTYSCVHLRVFTYSCVHLLLCAPNPVYSCVLLSTPVHTYSCVHLLCTSPVYSYLLLCMCVHLLLFTPTRVDLLLCTPTPVYIPCVLLPTPVYHCRYIPTK